MLVWDTIPEYPWTMVGLFFNLYAYMCAKKKRSSITSKISKSVSSLVK